MESLELKQESPYIFVEDKPSGNSQKEESERQAEW
jgi:hypothetical protein